MSRQAYLAIDLGAESGRVMAGRLVDGRLQLREVHRFLHEPARFPAGLHWDLTGIWSNLLRGLRQGLAWCRQEQLEQVSIGVDAWGVDCALLGRSGALLGLPFAYRDPRNVPAEEELFRRVSRERVYAATGIQFMSLNTLPQLVAWQGAEPEAFAAADKLLFMPDLFNYLLTGEAVVESSIASTSQMVDPRTGDWAWDLLAEVGLPTQMLGPIVPAGSPVGELLPQVRSEIGATPADGASRLQVTATAGHDTAAAVAAIPAASAAEPWCYISSGTWSLMGAELSEPCLTDAARKAPFTNECGVDGRIRFLKNIAGLWLVQECRRHLNKQGQELDYQQLTDAARSAPPLQTLLDTQHAPFAAPGEMPEKIAQYARETGQAVPSDVGAVIRACLESLALTYRLTLDKLEQVLGQSFEIVHVVGGGGKNDLLNQMTADCLGRPVIVGPYEATATGNILVQALATGEVRDLAGIRRVVVDSFQPQRYEPTDTAAWDTAYGRFQELIA